MTPQEVKHEETYPDYTHTSFLYNVTINQLLPAYTYHQVTRQ